MTKQEKKELRQIERSWRDTIRRMKEKGALVEEDTQAPTPTAAPGATEPKIGSPLLLF